MANESKKTSEITSVTGAAKTDKVLLLKDPTGSPLSRMITVQDLLANTANLSVVANTLTITGNSTPSNSTITVTKGTLFYDSDYLYIAVANNTLKRVALSAF